MPVIFPKSIPDPEYILIPEGEYSVEVVEVKEKRTSNDDEMWSVKLNITAGEFLGKKLFTNLVFSDGGLGNIKKFLKSAGFDMDIDRVDLRPESIDHAVLRATVVHEDYKGRPQSRIPYAGFAALDTLPATGMTSQPARTAAQQPVNEADPYGDNVPF